MHRHSYRNWIPALGVACALIVSAVGQPSTPLPVKKVVLYKNGIGYFQHLGTVHDSERVEITLPSRQLNDVLKSLTVLDLSNGRVTGITYDSSAPLERQLAESPIDLNSASDLADWLNQLRGTQVLVSTPAGEIRGKLVGAQWKNRGVASGKAEQVLLLSILTVKGTLEVTELEQAGGLQFLDPALVTDLGRRLDLLETLHRQDVRRLNIQTEGTGSRDLFVSYTAEAPIWKTSYRIVLDAKAGALLQGWAIVDNTTSLDWTDVDLSLVSGAPVSFIQDLSQPVYGNRPVVPPPAGIQISPEVHEGTLLQSVDSEAGRVGGLDEVVQQKSVRNMRKETFAAMAAPSPAMELSMARAPMTLGTAMEQSVTAAAEGAKVGDLFEYRMRNPVTIGKNQSALLPIVQARVPAEKVSVFSEGKGLRNPRLAIWLNNASGSTLDGGAFSIVDANTFAGEGLLETIQPKERRLLSYALDLAVEVATQSHFEERRVERLTIRQGILRFVRKQVQARAYTIRNNADEARAVLIEHPVRGDWKLAASLQPEETSASSYRFRVTVPAQSTVPFTVSEEKPVETHYQLSDLDSETVQVWLRDSTLDAAAERALRPLLDQRAEISQLSRTLAQLEQEESQIFSDQERVRENLNRMGQTPDEARLRQRYVSQLEQQENRLADLRSRKATLQTQLDGARQEFDRLVAQLEMDRQF